MIKVKFVVDYKGEHWISIMVGDATSAQYGPMSKVEAKAMVKGMKAFAQPHIVIFDLDEPD